MQKPTETELERGLEAAWGLRPASSNAVKIRRFFSCRNTAGTRLGFVVAELPSGLIIRCKMMSRPRADLWIAQPAEIQRDSDGQPGP
jgi:hypothetical protein